VEIAKKNENPILFTGDSITDGWRNQAAWKKYFDPMKAANFGIGGDRTEHVLWRLQNGELDGYTPKVVVLMIGTNNTGSNTADEIAEGIKAIIKTIHDKSKDTKVLLLAVFPRGEKPGTPVRDKIAAINKTISALDDGGKMVLYMDIGSKFTEPDGTLTKAIMPDFLHLSPRGYEIWGEAIVDTVQKLAGGDGKK
jgi:lysophospholipase L1-like esterase